MQAPCAAPSGGLSRHESASPLLPSLPQNTSRPVFLFPSPGRTWAPTQTGFWSQGTGCTLQRSHGLWCALVTCSRYSSSLTGRSSSSSSSSTAAATTRNNNNNNRNPFVSRRADCCRRQRTSGPRGSGVQETDPCVCAVGRVQRGSGMWEGCGAFQRGLGGKRQSAAEGN